MTDNMLTRSNALLSQALDYNAKVFALDFTPKYQKLDELTTNTAIEFHPLKVQAQAHRV